MKILKRIWQLYQLDAPKEQYYLEIGAFLLRKGAGYKLGETIYTKKVCGKQRAVYVKNLYFNFKDNKITHTLGEKVI